MSDPVERVQRVFDSWRRLHENSLGNDVVTEHLVGTLRHLDCVDMRNEMGYTLLELACIYNYAGTVSSLLRLGANPTRVGEWGVPMHSVRSVSVAQLLENRGAGESVFVKNRDGKTPRDFAVKCGLSDLTAWMTRMENKYLLIHEIRHVIENRIDINTLLKRGVDVDAADFHGWTSLKVASARGNSEVVTALLDAGADPNCNPCGLPATILACCEGHLSVVQLLILKGAVPPSSEEMIVFEHQTDVVAWLRSSQQLRLVIAHWAIERDEQRRLEKESNTVAATCKGNSKLAVHGQLPRAFLAELVLQLAFTV